MRKSSQLPNGFQGRACVRPGKVLRRLLRCCNRRHRRCGNLLPTVRCHLRHEGSKGEQPALSGSGLSWEPLTRGAAVGAGGAHEGWRMRVEKSAYQAALPQSKPGGCFHCMVTSDPHKELLRDLRSEAKSCKVLLPCIGVSTASTKTIFSRNLLMNFGFPPLTPRGAVFHFCGNQLGDNSLLIKKKNNPSSFFSVCVQIPALSITASL